jgi:hypothetical protein
MKNKTNFIGFKLFFVLVLLSLTVLGCMITASADDLEWNLLTDTEAGYRVHDYHSRLKTTEEADGTLVVSNTDGNYGALYIYDDKNILGTYRTFSLEGDFYFDAFPEGIRENMYTPEERPLSFLCWRYAAVDNPNSHFFNSIRIDSDGYIHTASDGSGKTDVKLEVGKWYNIRCVFTPMNGVSEMFINDEKVLDFSITRFDPNKYVSSCVRYFDGYYEGNFQMKNLKVKTDSNYTIELKREAAADYLGIQTAKPEGDTFTARAVFGVNDTVYNRVGYEVLLITLDEDGNPVSESISQKTKVVYDSLKDASGKTYNIKSEYGYNYAAAMEISGLPADPENGYFEIVVRPFILTLDGVRRYGVSTVLSGTGETDQNGYPILAKQTAKSYTIVASDDTYISNMGGYELSDFSKEKKLQVRNTGDVNAPLYRAAYYKFTLTAEQVKALESAVSAELRVYIEGTETHAERKRYDMMIHATGADWTESTLNYKNHSQKAMTGEELYCGPFKDGSYLAIDVLYYLRNELTNDDGSLTVSFRFANEGHSDALLNYLCAKESSYQPMIVISSSIYNKTLNLSKVGNKGYEPWGYAEALADEWFDELRDKIYPKDENGNLIYHEEVDEFGPEGYAATVPTGDYTREMTWKQGVPWNNSSSKNYRMTEDEWSKNKYARTLSTLGSSSGEKFLDSKYAQQISEYDEYGGIANAGFKGEATGFFHTEKLQGRTYIIDPLGNPYFAVGMNTIVLGDSTNHQRYSLEKFGTEEAYFEYITRSLQSVGINTAFESSRPQLLAVENGLNVLASVPGVSSYMSKIGRSQISEGVFPHNNTINVFDPDFVSTINAGVADRIKINEYKDNPHVFAYHADNELPSGADILDRYLTLDVAEEPGNSFSYALAWSFLKRIMDDPLVTLDDYMNSDDRAAINSEFLCFVYARQYRVIREAIEAVDTDHMYVGSRVNGTCYGDEGYHRAAGYYLDIITVNLYNGLNPKAEYISGIYRNSGKPYIVTEFFAKGMDAIDANGYPLANSTGAGILVRTQADRAAYYEHYVMNLLQSKGCVGWSWYRYRDNDQGIYSTGSSSTPLIMLHVTYGEFPKANTFMNMETGEILTAAQVGGNYRTLYTGERLASNQNVNKGIYNSDFSSVVVEYTYDKNGKLLGSKGYEVQTPESKTPAVGTVIKSADGTKSFTIGSVTAEDGTVTKTVLTVYEGMYLALAESYKSISDHIIGLVNYFDAK